MSLDNLKISTRLSAAFALLVTMMLAVAAAAMLQMGRMKASTEEITRNWLPSVEQVNQMNAAVSDFRVALTQHVLSSDAKALSEIEKNLAAALAVLDKDRQVYVKLISGDEERRVYEAFEADWKRYVSAQEQIVASSRKYEKDAAQALLEGAARQAYTSANADLDKLIEINTAGAVAASEAAEQSYATARSTLVVVVLLAAALAVVVALWLIRSITRPLALAVEAADRVANGDLSVAIEAQTRDETGLLLSALQRMQHSLVQTVGSVRQNADSVATASAEIAQGNTDLSARTEQQAGALEETAASMEQLGSTVRQNADNARQANQLAMNASDVATQGGDVVSQVVDTMKGINDSSKKIADIITVIDGIAFQTNILALNAAVEAARAGEQGRGFAVVAGEVRNLAQRAAAAAKEIKGLINASVERVEQGTVLVDRAGSTMLEVVGAIKRVTDIMGEISAASTEQSAGVAQVGEAVTQMDQATQQNAALVEESAAAAESLRAQAQHLVQAVAVFKLVQGHAAHAAAAAPSAGWTGAERRGPDRATNVTRPAFKAKVSPQGPAKAVKSPPLLTSEVPAATVPVPARTGTDDDWTSF